MRSFILVTFLVGAGLFGAMPGRAQVTTATFYGIVTDSSGAALHNATVTLTHEGAGTVTTKITDDAGEFVFNFLPVGLYTLKIEHQGFKTFEHTRIELRAAQNVRQSFALEVGEVTETVKITGESPLVNTVAPEQTHSFSSLEVKELPLARRNFNNILRIGTGITTAGEGGVRLNGLGRSGTKVAVDGTEASGNPEAPGTSMYQGFNYIDLLSIEAIQEVQTIKGVIQAEYGQSLSGNVNLITRSGTNEYHGSLFENYQGSVLRARNQFLTSPPRPKPPRLVFNQFGGSFGGPIRKDRLFIFGAYEGYREVAAQLVSGDVPTQRLREGMIAAVPDYKLAFDTLPLPNQVHDPTLATGRFIGLGLSRATDNHSVVKGDLHLWQNSNLALTYTRGRPFRMTPAVSPVNSRSWNGVQERVTVSFVTGGASWTSETRFGYNLNDIDRVDAFWEVVDPRQPETFFGGRRVPNINGLGFGTAESEIAEYGAGTGIWTLEEKFARTVGRHSLKFGGIYSSRGGGRSNIENPRFRYESEADMEANIPSGIQFTFGVNPYTSHSWELGFFAQDDWRVTPRLVLNFGLRYDYFSKFVAKPSTDAPAALFNLNGLLDAQRFIFGPFRDPLDPFESDSRNFGPRFGFAFNPDGKGKSVIRGGLSVMFSPLAWGAFNNAVANSMTLPFRTNFSKQEAIDLGLRFPAYNEDVQPLVERAGRTQIADIFDPKIHAPYSMNIYLGVQRELTSSLMLESAFVGNRGVSFMLYRIYNQVDPLTDIRPNPNMGQGNYLDNSQNSIYYSWQTSLRKRYSTNLSFGAHYTWGKALSYSGGDIGADFIGDSTRSIQEFFNVKAARGPSTGDITHYFAADWVYDLPKFGLNPVVGHILGGWQLSGVFRTHTGQPIQVTQPSSRSASRPDLIDFKNAINQNYRNDLQYLNKSVFAAVPEAGVSGATIRPGSYGNNALRGPGLWNLDFSIAKNFAITEQKRFQLRADMFNVLNHTNYTGISTNIESGNFGAITGTAGARVIQLNARFSF
jgi:Carboxypeptidase regulatory-like domain/TonB dependent receptor